MIGLTVGRGVLWGNTRILQARVVFGRIRWFFRQLFFLHTYTRAQNMYIYSMFLLNIVWLFCNCPFLSHIAVSNLTAIYIFLLHLGSIGQQHLQVHSLWGLKCLTSFFPEGSGFSILLGNGDHPCYFSFEFSFCSSLFSLCWFFSPDGARYTFFVKSQHS